MPRQIPRRASTIRVRNLTEVRRRVKPKANPRIQWTPGKERTKLRRALRVERVPVHPVPKVHLVHGMPNTAEANDDASGWQKPLMIPDLEHR